MCDDKFKIEHIEAALVDSEVGRVVKLFLEENEIVVIEKMSIEI